MIDLTDVSKSYGPGLPAVNHANLHIDKGEFVFVVGNSGSGKTTLIKLLMKELDSTSGQIIVSGERLEGMKHRRVAKYRRKLGVVFQDFRLLKDRNVYENVAFAQRVVNRPTRVIRKRVPEVLQEVGLAVKYKSFPDELSGGEQQRVALARALVNRPDILLADEPTGNLDPKTSEEIMKLLEQINDRGTTVLVVTHNKEIVNAMKKRVVTMHEGSIISDEKAADKKFLVNDHYDSGEKKLHQSHGNMIIIKPCRKRPAPHHMSHGKIHQHKQKAYRCDQPLFQCRCFMVFQCLLCRRSRYLFSGCHL